MFRIGDFSRIARVSCRQLRFYDEIGLFQPAQSDGQTGYRYYALSQLPKLNRIAVLKDLGFSLDEIGQILQSRVGVAELRSMLKLKRSEVEHTLASEAQRLRQIETRIAQIELDGEFIAEDVIVRSQPAIRILSMRRVARSFAEARDIINLFRKKVSTLLPKRSNGQLVVITHSPQFEDDELDLEFGFTITGRAADSLPDGCGLTLVDFPAVERMAVCVRAGPPDVAHLVTAKIGRYLEQSGNSLCGPGREVFLNLPAPDRMEDAVVEMQFPVESAISAN